VLLQVEEVENHLELPWMMEPVWEGLKTFTTKSSKVLGCLQSEKRP
jgi:hypothetical protein